MSVRDKLVPCLGLAVLALALPGPAAAEADFGIQSMNAATLNENGSPDLQAGSHPYEFRLSFEMNQNAEEEPEGTLHELFVDLPPGMVGNPLAVPRCSGADFEGVSPRCPGNTQVGVAVIHITGFPTAGVVPIYNLTPPQGVPASIGFSIANNNSFQEASLRAADYGVRISDITIPNKPIQSVEARVWGLPALATHNSERFCIVNGLITEGCTTDSAPVAFLTLPTSCVGPLKWTLSVGSVQEPGVLRSASVESLGPGGVPRGLGGCGKLPFAPTIASRPETTSSDSPTGLHFNLHIPQATQLSALQGELEPRDEVQSLKVKASTGEFTLTFREQTTGELPFDATAAEVQAALEGLSSIGAGNVLVSGGLGDPDGSNPYVITFVGGLSDQNLPLVSGLLNTSPGSAIVTTVRHGQAAGETGIVEARPELATANLKDTVVKLPVGLAINPSAASGRGACPLSGPEGVNLPGSGGPAEAEPAHCPQNSKVGTVEVHTPLIDHPLPGTVYLARQGENPFGSLIALYVAVNDPKSGVVVKLAGKVEPDLLTSQLTATFRNNPQLPFEDFDFEFFGGPRAALTTPPTCGIYTTEADLTPWTAPEGKDTFPSDIFPISSGPAGPCPASEVQMPNAPGFEAGTAKPLAGSFSPFVLKLSRENGSQRFRKLNVTLPPGLSAKLSGVQECSDAQIGTAEARNHPGEGALEQASPSCPAASEVGVVNVGAGSGSPLYVQGHAYLSGPYGGAPLSLAIISPAVAGPFDLGAVVVRSALFINEETGQATVKSDPIPTILQGIPLDVRTIAVKIDRPNFAINPTSCEEKAISGEEISTTGAVAALQNRFQVAGCGDLGYSPKLALTMKGATSRRGHPALKSLLTQPSGQANSRRISVVLPATEFIDQSHIANPCTRPQFAEGKCPPASVLGRARVFTPLLEKPLEGQIYFRANGGERELPDVVVDLHGQVHIVLVGFTDSVHKEGSESSRVRTIFAAVPDAPVSKAVIELNGGKKGLLVNSANICKVPNKASVKLTGQNGRARHLGLRIGTSCRNAKHGR